MTNGVYKQFQKNPREVPKYVEEYLESRGATFSNYDDAMRKYCSLIWDNEKMFVEKFDPNRDD